MWVWLIIQFMSNWKLRFSIIEKSFIHSILSKMIICYLSQIGCCFFDALTYLQLRKFINFICLVIGAMNISLSCIRYYLVWSYKEDDQNWYELYKQGHRNSLLTSLSYHIGSKDAKDKGIRTSFDINIRL